MNIHHHKLSSEAHSILRIYEMFFSLTFRFMEEYKVNEFSMLMIITTIAIANSNELEADLDLISEETDIPYSTVRRKVEKMCEDGILSVKKSQNRLTYELSKEIPIAHPNQIVDKVNKNFKREISDIVIREIKNMILENK